MADAPALDCVVSDQRIVVRNWRLDCRIGYPESERERSQPLRLDLDIGVAVRRPLNDEIAQVVDYAPLLKEIETACATSHPRLLETLAEEILAICLARPVVETARVRIEKLTLLETADGVGIEMEWCRAKKDLQV
jgi:dihydroneopterin aldolase